MEKHCGGGPGSQRETELGNNNKKTILLGIMSPSA